MKKINANTQRHVYTRPELLAKFTAETITSGSSSPSKGKTSQPQSSETVCTDAAAEEQQLTNHPLIRGI